MCAPPPFNITRMQTDGAGRTVKTVTPKNFDWLQSYNGASQPKDSTDPLGGKIQRVYDAAHRLVSIADQNGNPVERYAYDARGNVVSKTDATNQSEVYQYDLANRLTQTTTRKGEVITYGYDGQDRLTQIVRPNATTNYSYDAAGRLIQVQEGSTRLQYDYDQADRLVREIQDTPQGYHSVEYQYDALDRRISRKVNGASETKICTTRPASSPRFNTRARPPAISTTPQAALSKKPCPAASRKRIATTPPAA